MDLRELGALLREERERRGISPNDVTEQIKISRSTLDAIEEGEKDKLPHKVYAKGFIKNYARLLDIDPEEVTEALSLAYGGEEDTLARPAYSEPKGSVSSIRTGQQGGKKSPAIGLSILAILVIGGAILWYFSFFAPKQQAAHSEQPAAGEVAREQAPAADNGAQGTQTPASSLDEVSSAQNAAQGAETDAPAEPEGAQVPESASEQALAGSPTSPADQASPASEQPQTETAPLPGDQEQASEDANVLFGEGPNKVVIAAKETTWLEAAADGGAMNELTLNKGQTLTGQFDNVLLVRLGNAGGVDIRFNGKPYVFEGGAGKVKTLRFTAAKNAALEERTPAAPAAQESATAPASPDASATAGAQESAEAAPVTAGEKTLGVSGTDGSWIIVIPDGKGAKEIFVKRGERLNFGFANSIEVRLGNPSRVVFSYDGKEYPVSSEKGESKTVRFPQ